MCKVVATLFWCGALYVELEQGYVYVCVLTPVRLEPYIIDGFKHVLVCWPEVANEGFVTT